HARIEASAARELERLGAEHLAQDVEHLLEDARDVRALDAPKRLDEEPVASEDRGRVAVDDARRGLAAPLVAEIDHVVVEERRGVHELRRDGDQLRARVEPASEARGERDAHRAEALSFEAQQVPHALLDRVLARSARADRLEGRVDDAQIVLDAPEELTE